MKNFIIIVVFIGVLGAGGLYLKKMKDDRDGDESKDTVVERDESAKKETRKAASDTPAEENEAAVDAGPAPEATDDP